MRALIMLEWQFSPSDYFEDPTTISRDDYTMMIENGRIEARIDSVRYDADLSLRDTLHAELNDRFLAVQLLSHKPYDLSKSRMSRQHPDGRRDIFLDAEPLHLKLSGGRVDVQVKDKNGNVIVDSRRDRIEKKKNLADSISTHRHNDALLNSLLNSYHAAVNDPNNELVHLYEMRDALSGKFCGKDEACSALGFSAPQWSRFGQLCNDEPLRQGRHRGKGVGSLRDATEGELTEARSIARGMVESYLHYLETSNRLADP
jgi:hypothetical protein